MWASLHGFEATSPNELRRVKGRAPTRAKNKTPGREGRLRRLRSQATPRRLACAPSPRKPKAFYLGGGGDANKALSARWPRSDGGLGQGLIGHVVPPGAYGVAAFRPPFAQLIPTLWGGGMGMMGGGIGMDSGRPTRARTRGGGGAGGQ